MSHSGESRSESDNEFYNYHQEKEDIVIDIRYQIHKIVITYYSKNYRKFMNDVKKDGKLKVMRLFLNNNRNNEALVTETLRENFNETVDEVRDYLNNMEEKLKQKTASPVTPPKKTRQVSLREMTAMVGKNKKSKKSKKKSKRNNKRKPSKKK